MLLIVCLANAGTAVALEAVRGLHPLYDASLGRVVVATCAGAIGGYLYRAQLAAVSSWLAPRKVRLSAEARTAKLVQTVLLNDDEPG